MEKIQTAYPLPKNMLPEDIEKRLSEHRREIKLLWKNGGDGRVIDDRQTRELIAADPAFPISKILCIGCDNRYPFRLQEL